MVLLPLKIKNKHNIKQGNGIPELNFYGVGCVKLYQFRPELIIFKY